MLDPYLMWWAGLFSGLLYAKPLRYVWDKLTERRRSW